MNRAQLFISLGRFVSLRLCSRSASLTRRLPLRRRAKKPAATKKSTATKTTYSANQARARRAGRARARAAAAQRAAAALKEAQQPRFKFDDSGPSSRHPRAEAAIIYNPQTGKILWESNAQDQRSIASITKVMTAVVFLEDSPDLSQPVVVQRADMRGASTTYLKAGDKVTKEDLLHLMLIASDNAAARVLARSSSYGSEGFVERMNQKAIDLGLTSTKYADPSGLLAANVSSAYDMAKLITYVSVPQISDVMQKQEYTATPAAGRSTSTRPTSSCARATSTCRQERPDSSPRPATASPRCCACRRAARRSPSSCSVRSRTPAASGRRATCSTGCRRKAQDSIGGTPVEAAPPRITG